MYPIIRNTAYDYVGQSYATFYPNLHKYPATMLPQIGISILKEVGIGKNTKLLDPYCGSGSSFSAGLDLGIEEMCGFDINPLAVLISKAKVTKIDLIKLEHYKQWLRNQVFEFIKDEKRIVEIEIPEFTNIDFWFSKEIAQSLAVIKKFIDKIKDKNIKNFILVPFSETVRDCSYTRNGEFKLYRMKSEDILKFNPDVYGVFFSKLNKVCDIYEYAYYPKLSNNLKAEITYDKLPGMKNYFDVVLTSPPYGDSSTTVAYGQFSQLSNDWLGIKEARQVDKKLMGGQRVKEQYQKGIIGENIKEIELIDKKRSLEVSSFYFDLEESINQVSDNIKPGGFSIYVVGNRRVKGVQLQTDQFIAERFEEKGFKHLYTYERSLTSKVMPSLNSPTNKTGIKVSTMTQEFIIVCKKL